LGIFWKKAPAKSAKLTLWIGSAMGAAVFAANKLYPVTVISHLPFMMMAFYLFSACVLMQVTFSWKYPVQHNSTSINLYWKSIYEPLKSPGWKWIGNYKFLSLLLLLIMSVLFWVFR
jgi:solute:Na+ symporter, SSS family